MTPGEPVLLRPHRPEDIELDRQAFVGPEGWGEFEWFGHSDPTWLAKQFAQDGLLSEHVARLVIEAHGEWAGRVTWFSKQHAGPDSSCWQLAVIVRPDLRGKGIGTHAHRLIVDYLFQHSRHERIEALTDVANVPEQRALAGSGFTQEGVLRRVIWRSGAWHDYQLWSILRADPR